MNFVISLPSADDRRLHIAEEFEKKSITYTFFDAVQPHQIHEMEEKYGFSLYNSCLTGGEKACFFSHVEIWNRAVEQKLPYVAIFEDDIFLCRDASDFLKNFDWVPQSCHIIKLEMFDEYVLMELNKIFLNNNYSLRKLKRKHLGTAGYILSLDGAISYLNYIKDKDINVPLDHLMFENYLKDGEYSVYQMVSGLSVQADRIGSSILKSQLERDRSKNKNNIAEIKNNLNLMQKIKREILRLIYQVKIKFCRVGFHF